MADAGNTNDPIAELIATTEEATDAWMRGDMDRYLARPTTPAASP